MSRPEIYREHNRTARKSHACVECRRSIQVGNEYVEMIGSKSRMAFDKTLKPDSLERRMSSLVPRLKFKGNLSWDNFRKRLGDRGYEYYRDKAYGSAGEHLWEAMNFANGKRNIFDIYIRISAEFSNVDDSLILRLFKDLEKAGLASIRKI